MSALKFEDHQNLQAIKFNSGNQFAITESQMTIEIEF